MAVWLLMYHRAMKMRRFPNCLFEQIEEEFGDGEEKLITDKWKIDWEEQNQMNKLKWWCWVSVKNNGW